MTAIDLPTVALPIPDPRQPHMPGRFRQMPISSTMIVGGIAVAVTGSVLQVARATVGPQMFAAMGGSPDAPDLSAWTGTAIALSGAFTAIFAAVGKVIIDLYKGFNAARLEADTAKAAAELEAVKARAAQEIDQARSKAAVEQERFEGLIESMADKIAELSQQMGGLQAKLDVANAKLAKTYETVTHTDKNVSQAKLTSSRVDEETVKKTIENTKKIEQLEAQIGSSSGVDIPVTPSE